MNPHPESKLPLRWMIILVPFGAVVTALFFIIAGHHIGQIQQALEIHRPKFMGVLVYTTFTGISAGLYYLLLKHKNLSLIRAGFRNKFSMGGILAVLTAFVLITFILYPLTALLLDTLHIPMLWGGNSQISLYQLSLHKSIIFIFLAGILGPLFEEIVFRGYLFQALNERFNTWIAITLSALAFAAIHIYTYGPGFVIWVFFFGIATAYLYKKYDSIYPGLLFHITNNLWAFLVVPILFKR